MLKPPSMTNITDVGGSLAIYFSYTLKFLLEKYTLEFIFLLEKYTLEFIFDVFFHLILFHLRVSRFFFISQKKKKKNKKKTVGKADDLST